MKVSKKSQIDKEALKAIRERDIGKLGRKCDFLVKTKATFTSPVKKFLLNINFIKIFYFCFILIKGIFVFCNGIYEWW